MNKLEVIKQKRAINLIFIYLQKLNLMKRYLLIILIGIMIFPFNSKATHLMGGEITVQHLSGSDYAIIATAYRDTIGISMAFNLPITITNQTTGWDTVINVFHDTIISGSLVPLIPYGTEIYIFTDTFSFPYSGQYTVNWENCCRNNAIVNLASPGSESMFLHAEVMIDTTNNSTPYFLAPPISYLPVNTPWTYNPLPFDLNGDSLVWSLDTPHTSYGIQCAGYMLPEDTSGLGAFSIDPVTGDINWTASFVGNYVTTVLVEEYRNGVKIGEIRRDMQLIVIPAWSALSVFTNINTVPTNTAGYPYISLAPNQNYQLSLLGSDPDVSDVVVIEAFGEPIINCGANFSYTNTGIGNEVEGVFDWTPDVSMVRSKPYIMVFRVSDNLFATDQSILFEVSGSATSIFDTEKTNIGSIYPNPASHQFIIPINIYSEKTIKIEVYNIMGNKVQLFTPQKMQTGNHLVMCDLDLSSGQYFVSIKSEHETLSAQKIIVVK